MVQTLESPASTALDAPVRFRLGPLLSLLRPRHWIKGAPVIVAPVITAPLAAVTHAAAVGLTLAAFLAASSTVYVLNDLRDREADRLHPVKRLRALASGRVTARAAAVLLVVLTGITAALLTLLPFLIAAIIGAYVAVNVWYSLALKHQPLVDVSVVAGGFVLRVLAGTAAAGLPVRPFLLICVYCACVALSLGKRRHELAVVGGEHRAALSAYSVSFLDHVVVVNLVVALAGYVAFLWGLTAPYGAVATVVTFPFATFTIYRYLQMVMVDRSGGDPVVDLIRDGSMRAGAGLWAVALGAVLIASAL